MDQPEEHVRVIRLVRYLPTMISTKHTEIRLKLLLIDILIGPKYRITNIS